jgi:hypothetical protein
MYEMINLTFLYAGGIEPRPWLRPPQPHRRGGRPARAALGRLLFVTGGVLRRTGARLSDPCPSLAPVGPRLGRR